MPLRARRGKWHYRFWEDGHEFTASTGLVATERNRSAAVLVEAKARELVKTGRAHELKITVKPFSEAAAEFLDWADVEHSDHPNTSKRLRTSFASLCQFFGNVPVSAILRGHILDYKAWRRKEHEVANVTIRNDLHALSKGFRYFVSHNWARENPVRAEDIPTAKDAVRIHVVSAEEEALYFDTARVRYPALYDLGRLMLDQGCRPDELLDLRTTDIDLERGFLTIRKGKSHGAKRRLRLTAESREICARRVALGSAWLFPGKLPGTRAAKLNGQHARLLEDLALCKCGHRRMQHGKEKCPCGCALFTEVSRVAFVIYDLRHTFATRAAESGMAVPKLAAILGHGDFRSVTKYVHIRQEAMDEAMETYERMRNGTDAARSAAVGGRKEESSDRVQ